MGTFIQDVRFATRVLRRSWGVTLIAVLSLAVAIGGNASVFALVNALLFQPLSVSEPERLVVLQERSVQQPEGLSTLSTSLPNHTDIAERSRTVTEWTVLRPTVLGLRNGETSEPVTSAEVGANFFQVAGIELTRGRAFLPEEGVPGGRKVAIVTPEFWERTQGGEGEPLGSVLTLNTEPVEVVGVMPEGFTFLFSAADVWVPLTDSPTESPRDRRDVISIGRMAPGAGMDQVRREMADLATALAAEHPQVQRDRTLDVFNARTDIPDTRTKVFYGLLQGSVFFVLLIACANIANLLLARSQERGREIALRTVLGAGRWRLTRQLLTESGLLVAAGAALGLLFGWLGTRLMADHFAGFFPASFTPSLDPTVLLFTAGISVAAGVLFGVAPVLKALGTDHAEALKEGGGKSSAGRSRLVATRLLVVGEIALSLVALGGGGMMIRSFLEIQGADPGFDGSPILTATIRVPDSKYPDDERRDVFLQEVLERLRGLEGARSAALANVLPRNVQAPSDTFRLLGRDAAAAGPPPEAISLRTSPEYVDAFGIDLVRGRFFHESDRLGSAPVAVVNRSFAERWMDGADPVGEYVVIHGEAHEIVGLVEDVQQVVVRTPGQVHSEAVYTPAAQAPGTITKVVVAAEDPGSLKPALRASLQSLDPDLTLSQILTMDEFVERFFVGIQVFNTILGSFGILAILLASLGTYGVLAYQVAQRRHEIGIRMAVGARSREVVGMITRQGLGMSLAGLALGGVVLVPLTQLIRSMLAGFATVSGGTAFAVAGILFAVTLAASLIPGYRASALDPVRALREE